MTAAASPQPPVDPPHPPFLLSTTMAAHPRLYHNSLHTPGIAPPLMRGQMEVHTPFQTWHETCPLSCIPPKLNRFPSVPRLTERGKKCFFLSKSVLGVTRRSRRTNENSLFCSVISLRAVSLDSPTGGDSSAQRKKWSKWEENPFSLGKAATQRGLSCQLQRGVWTSICSPHGSQP